MFFVGKAVSDNKLLSDILELNLDDGKSVLLSIVREIKRQINLKVSTNKNSQQINPKVSTNNNQQKPFASYEAPKALSTNEKRELFSCIFAMSSELFANESKSKIHSGFDSKQSLRFIVLENYLLSKTQKEFESVGSKLDSFKIGVNLRA